MRLYFAAGKTRRLAIDTNRKTWNNHYSYLGGFREYIKISIKDYNNLLREIDFNGYDYDNAFLEVKR